MQQSCKSWTWGPQKLRNFWLRAAPLATAVQLYNHGSWTVPGGTLTQKQVKQKGLGLRHFSFLACPCNPAILWQGQEWSVHTRWCFGRITTCNPPSQIKPVIMFSLYITMESQNHLGWKRPLGPSSPSVKPALQILLLNHVPKCYNYTFFKEPWIFWLNFLKTWLVSAIIVRAPFISSKFTATPGLQRQSFNDWFVCFLIKVPLFCQMSWDFPPFVFLPSIFVLSVVWISRFCYWQVYIHTKRCMLFCSLRTEKPLAHVCVSHASIPECILTFKCQILQSP